MLNSKSYFNNVPLEDDTTILRNDFRSIDNMPVLFQVWACDGTTACSAVVPESYTESLGEAELLNRLRTGFKIDNGYTLKRSENYTFVNFGFCH